MENDKLQLIVIGLWIAAIIYILSGDLGGVANIQTLDISMLNGLSMGATFVFIAIIFLPWTALARKDHWQRIVAADTDSTAKSAYGVLIIVMFVAYSLFALCGLYLAANYPGIEHNDAPFKILAELPPYLVAFASIGIVAALISSADSFLNITSLSTISLISNFVQANKSTSGINDVNLGKMYRIVTIIIGIAAYQLVVIYDDLAVWVIMATSAFAILVPSFIGSLIKPNNNKIPSVVSVGLGIATYTIILLSGVVKPDEAFVYATILATIGYLVTLFIFGKILKKKYA